MISVSHIVKNYTNWWKSPYWYPLGKSPTWRFIKILPFWQRAQNTKQHISVDSPSCAEQNSTNDFVMACMVVEILCSVEPLKAGFWRDFEAQVLQLVKCLEGQFRKSAKSTFEHKHYSAWPISTVHAYTLVTTYLKMKTNQLINISVVNQLTTSQVSLTRQPTLVWLVRSVKPVLQALNVVPGMHRARKAPNNSALTDDVQEQQMEAQMLASSLNFCLQKGQEVGMCRGGALWVCGGMRLSVYGHRQERIVWSQ